MMYIYIITYNVMKLSLRMYNNYYYYTHSTEYCNLIGQRPWNNSRYSTALEGDVLNNIATSGYYEEYV